MASAGEGARTPFLNDYKLQFFWKRFPQTVSGGLRLNIGAPCYVYLYQIIVFLWPAILGGIFTALTEHDIIKDNICCYIYSGLVAFTVISVHSLRHFLCNGTRKSERSALAEDDEVDFISCCDKETFAFIFPAKKYTLNIVIHGLLSGVLCGSAFLYLLPSTISVHYNTATVVVVYAFGWLTLSTANLSLTVQAPPETAIFQSLDDLGLTSLMRPFYVGVIVVIGVLARHYPQLSNTSMALYIVMVLLPVMWMVGVLPPLDALFSWLGEQVLVFTLGGTYMTSDFRLLVSLLLSGTTLLVGCFVTEHTVLITFCAASGFILSHDLFQMVENLSRNLFKVEENHNIHHQSWTVIDVSKHTIMLVLCVIIAGASSHFYKDATKNMFDAFGYVFIAMFLLLKLLGDLQQTYICAGLIRNPLHTKNATSLPELKKFHLQMRYLGQVYNILHTYVCPLVMVAFLGTFLNTSQQDLHSFFIALGTTRVLRWVWQGTMKCLLEMAILCLTVWCNMDIDWWNDLGVGLQLMMIGIIRDRLDDFLQKATFMVTMYITSWSEPKQRHRITGPTLIASAVFFPCVLAILLVSAALSSPLTPLFCFPVFLVGFPRPKRSWPSPTSQSSSGSEGCVFYQQLVPKLYEALQDSVASGTLVSTSDFILVRYQDRTMILQVLERGYKHCTVIARGLELQETSCHTVEAAMIDDIFEEAFCKERKSSFGMNNFVLNTLTPSQCLVLETYSDTHNVLTGVIDQPQNIERQASNFMKCLLWVFLKHREELRKDNLAYSKISQYDDLGDTEQQFGPPPEHNEVLERKSDGATADQVKAFHFKTKGDNTDSSSVTRILDREWSDTEWSEEDDEPEGKKPQQNEQDFISPLGEPLMNFGLPAQDIGQTANTTGKTKTETVHLLRKKGTEKGTKLAQSKIFPLNESSKDFPFTELEKLNAWANLLTSCKRVLPQIESDFPNEWFSFVLKNGDDGAQTETDCEALLGLYKEVVMCCYAVVNMLGLHGSILGAGPQHIYRVYQGRIPWSPQLDLMEQDEELTQLVLKAFRYAFKLTYDEAVLGLVEDEIELLENLKDYEKNWFIGVETGPGWTEAIVQERPNLFSIGYDDAKASYTSHLLTRQELAVYTGTLNGEALRGQWASLALELLYLTNDDEERYSIQAHPVLLRNLTIQAADPPLGYAVYCSGPLYVPYGLL